MNCVQNVFSHGVASRHVLIDVTADIPLQSYHIMSCTAAVYAICTEQRNINATFIIIYLYRTS